jgi:hypothetical protein
MRITLLFIFTLGGFIADSSTPYMKLSNGLKTGYSSFVFGLDDAALQSILAEAPASADEMRSKAVQIQLPDQEGNLMSVEVTEAPIMAPELSAKYPAIKTYKVVGPGVSGRIGYTYKGFHAILFTTQGTLYIDPIGSDPGTYHTYHRNDYMAFYSHTKGHHCLVDDAQEQAAKLIEIPAEYQGQRTGEQLRTYRLALACTGEYAQFHGGTIPNVLSAMVVSMNRVNGVYEREFSITMEIIADNDQIIFLNANTDPYTNSSGFTMLGQNQSTIDNIIGSANYDIGHVYSTGGGGIASLGSVCSPSNKARGVTGGPAPVGDPFDIDYVAHEMGHQFGANHTQNNECNRNPSTAYEPGSASTIMGYAGICPPNLQNNSDDYFHAGSYNEVRQFSQNGFGNSCASVTNTGNTPPSVAVDPATYTIPRETPFVLRGTATDNEGDDLSYCWEQMDIGPSGSPTNPSGNAPIFRSFDPVNHGERTFPMLVSVISGSLVVGETYPTYSRGLSFRLTARDNNSAGGGIGFDEVDLGVDGSKGPFVVTSPPQNALVETQAYYMVEWDVAGTDQSPINCDAVHILAYNGNGLNFIDTIAANVPNTGSYLCLMDLNPGAGFRIRVEAADNVFFNLNPGAFTFVAPSALSNEDILLSLEPDFSTGSMVLNWNDPFSNELNWVIEKSIEGNTSFLVLDTLQVNDTMYVDTAVNMLGTAYYYRVYAINSVGSSNFSNEVTWSGVGIEEVDGFELGLFPNPANHQITISHQDVMRIQRLEISDESGRVCLEVSPAGKSIDVQSLAPGVYFLKAYFESGNQLIQQFSVVR